MPNQSIQLSSNNIFLECPQQWFRRGGNGSRWYQLRHSQAWIINYLLSKLSIYSQLELFDIVATVAATVEPEYLLQIAGENLSLDANCRIQRLLMTMHRGSKAYPSDSNKASDSKWPSEPLSPPILALGLHNHCSRNARRKQALP